MTAIVAVNFDWSIESCDIAPLDLNYERNTEKYGRAMKLTVYDGGAVCDANWDRFFYSFYKFVIDSDNLYPENASVRCDFFCFNHINLCNV